MDTATFNQTWRYPEQRVRYYKPEQDPFHSLSADDRLLYWVCLGTMRKYKPGTYGVYVEFQLDTKSNKLFCIGCTFHTYRAFSSVSPIGRISIDAASDAQLRLDIKEHTDIYLDFECTLISHIDKSKRSWCLDTISAALVTKRYKIRPVEQMVWPILDGRESPSAGQIDVPCPVCFGMGDWLTFGLPRDSTSTGYERYLENTLNGAEACKTCGGNGAHFDPWYIKENPEVVAESPKFRRGKGVVPVDRPPTVVAL